MDVEVRGAENLPAIAAALRTAADKELKREVYRALNTGSKAGRDLVRESVPLYMPTGYAPTLEKTLRMTTTARGGKDPAVKVVARAASRKGRKRYLGKLDRGTLRHPTFGRYHSKNGKSLWFNQAVSPGFFTDPMKLSMPEMRDELVKAMARVGEFIQSRGR